MLGLVAKSVDNSIHRVVQSTIKLIKGSFDFDSNIKLHKILTAKCFFIKEKLCLDRLLTLHQRFLKFTSEQPGAQINHNSVHMCEQHQLYPILNSDYPGDSVIHLVNNWVLINE